MREKSFKFLWDHAITIVAREVYKSIPNNSKVRFSVKLDISDDMFQKVFNTYKEIRDQVKAKYFDSGEDNDKKIDSHKIGACITGSLMRHHLIKFDAKSDMSIRENTEENNLNRLLTANASVAFWASIGVIYLLLLSDYLRDDMKEEYKILCKQGGFRFPATNQGHDEYTQGRIKALALNDAYGNDFDVLSYADMLFWIEKYNKDLISEKIKKEK